MKERQAERPRFTLERAREIHEAPSPMISHILLNPEGDYSVMSHIVCEWCDYCEEQKNGIEIHNFKEDPYEIEGAVDRDYWNLITQRSKTIARTDSGAEYHDPEEHYWRSTEFSCAMKKLDDLGIPRKDEEGETYSIVGRINLLSKR